MFKKHFFFIILNCFLNILFCNESERRNKDIDDTYTYLIPLSSVPFDCESTTNGYAIIENGLEKCEFYLNEDKSLEDKFDIDYETYKCKNLRVHGELDDKHTCKCKKGWKGAICNEYEGCLAGFSLFKEVCTLNVCQHDGKLAISTKRIECICKAPWEGRWCERLACWRMASKEHETRWKNAGDHCICANGYEGENCDKIVFCKNGELVDGRCECKTGFKGEICDKKCTPNLTCGTNRLSTFIQTNFQLLIFLCLICFLLQKL